MHTFQNFTNLYLDKFSLAVTILKNRVAEINPVQQCFFSIFHVSDQFLDPDIFHIRTPANFMSTMTEPYFAENSICQYIFRIITDIDNFLECINFKIL